MMQKKFFQKSTIESGRQAIENWSISYTVYGVKKIFFQIDCNVIKTILNWQNTLQNDFYGVAGW